MLYDAVRRATSLHPDAEGLSEAFSLLTVFFWDLPGGALQPSKQRKVTTSIRLWVRSHRC